MTSTRTQHISRRAVLGSSAGAAILAGLAGCGDGSGAAPPSGEDPSTPIRFTWWGSDFYIDLTNEMIAAFEEDSDYTVEPEPGTWEGYWDRLATQFAATDAPDVINMDGKYLAEYAGRGALADLSAIEGVDVSGLTEADLADGTVDGKLCAASTGNNSWMIFANPTLFDEAGVDLPDDKTWTWDEYFALAEELTSGEVLGTAGGGSNADLTTFLRQFGEDFYTPDGLGYQVSTLTQWFDWYLKITEAGVAPSAQQTVEESTVSIEQSLFGTNKAATGWYWSNNLQAMRDATGHDDIVMLRPPSHSGKLAENGAYLKASMYWSINSGAKNPEGAAALVNFLMNDPKAAEIQMLNRGVPANPDAIAAMKPNFNETDTYVTEMITALRSEITSSPAIQPKGTSTAQDVLTRHLTDVRFKRTTPADAAEKTTTEIQALIDQAG